MCTEGFSLSPNIETDHISVGRCPDKARVRTVSGRGIVRHGRPDETQAKRYHQKSE
jgi:hypothetical protein